MYTGSFFTDDGRYFADLEGVLIGFIHRSAPIFEYPLNEGMGAYGHVIFNPIRMTVKATEPVEP